MDSFRRPLCRRYAGLYAINVLATCARVEMISPYGQMDRNRPCKSVRAELHRCDFKESAWFA